MTNLSVSLKEKNVSGIDRLSKVMDRPRSWLVNDAIERYLEHHMWMDKETEAAIQAIDAGSELISHDEVVARAEERANARKA